MIHCETLYKHILKKMKLKNKKIAKKFFAEESSKHLQKLDVLGKLYGNGDSYFVDNHLTWADLYFYALLDHFHELDADCVNNYQ